jgi:CheY-like chemotaxis protein
MFEYRGNRNSVEMDSELLDVPRILLLENSQGEAEPLCHGMLVPWDSLGSLPQAVRPWIDVRHSATDALISMRKQAELEPRNLPVLIALDLDLPRRTSLSFLQTLRQDPGLKNLPVIVMAWPEEEGVVRSLYGLGVSAYVIKPVRFADLLAVAGQVSCNSLLGHSGQELCRENLGAHISYMRMLLQCSGSRSTMACNSW